MFGKALTSGFLAAAMLASAAAARADTITHAGTTIVMPFVTVGNPGNAADPATGSLYGAVGYAYRIGTYDVTAAQWAAVYAADPNVGSAGYWSGSQPVTDVSWNKAAMFCNWLTTGNADSGYYTIVGGSATPSGLSHDAYAALHGTTYFIPTEDEWYKAAYYDPNKPGGAGYWLYPTGSNGAPTAVYSGTAAGTAVFYDSSNGVEPSAPANVNDAGGLSPYGTMGQGGNLWQWNETDIFGDGSSRGLRGGSFYDHSSPLASSFRDDIYPTFENGYLGFRVASTPEPGSITLLVAGAIAGLIWLRRWR